MGASLSLVPVLDYFARRECLGAGLRQNAVTLPYPDGGAGATCTVQYWAPLGKPQLPPLLLVHGFGPRADWQWRCQVGPLSRHFHVIVPDLLGFGGSSYPFETAPPPTEATQAAVLAALLDALPGMEGRRVAVAGTSYGGFVAYWLARAAGAARVGPVVIASSDLLKTAADDRAFLKRAGEGWGGVDEILLPAEPAALRKLLELASYRPPPRLMTPDFLLRDFIQVRRSACANRNLSSLTVSLVPGVNVTLSFRSYSLELLVFSVALQNKSQSNMDRPARNLRVCLYRDFFFNGTAVLSFLFIN
jgi:pimeloyl-ACP methyl ester carboxylesterase